MLYEQLDSINARHAAPAARDYMYSIEELGPVVFGAGAFNDQYNKDNDLGDTAETLRRAFEKGIHTVDTAAFYGPSEEYVGAALKQLSKDYPRESYFLCTKAGRWETDEFDYSPESIRRSVERSLSRLGTKYLDLLYIHDVEFQTAEQADAALATAAELKKEGIIRYFGFSGYPVPSLVETAERISKDAKIGPADAVLSYCNLTLQNDQLLAAVPKLKAAGVKVVLNASPLSMSLLRSGKTHDFHPASPELRAAADKLGADLKKQGVELADLAIQYSFNAWNGPTVIGLRSPQEVDAVLAQSKVKPDPKLVKEAKDAFGSLYKATWDSGHVKGSA